MCHCLPPAEGVRESKTLKYEVFGIPARRDGTRNSQTPSRKSVDMLETLIHMPMTSVGMAPEETAVTDR